MSFLHVSDSELFKIYNEDPVEAIDFFRIKYEDEIKNLKTVYEFYNNSSYTEKDFISDIEILNKQFIKKRNYDVSFNIVGDYLNTKINAVLEIIHNEAFKEIAFDSFREYFLMVEGKDSAELKRMQMARFNYIGRPLLDERDQVYDSLLILEHYIFDANSNEIVYSPEEIGYVNSAIIEIKNLMSENRIEEAKLKLVALQVIMSLDIRFYSTLKIILDNFLSLSKIINVDIFNNNRNNNKDDDLDNTKKKGPIR